MIPGGHLTPALGLIDWIKQHHPETQIVFVGRKYSQPKLKQLAFEYQEISQRQVEFVSFQGVKSTASLLAMPLRLIQLIISIVKALRIMNSYQPDVLMSFGGYMAVPLVLAAKIKGVPVLTHEGTSVVGRANKILFKLANRVVYSYPQFNNFDISKLNKPCFRTGTPLRQRILSRSISEPPSWLKKDISKDQPVLLILGGSQGSQAINQLVSDSLVELTKRWTVIHQCGRANITYQYHDDLVAQATNLNIAADRYYVREWIPEDELAWLYQVTSIALSRAGANTIEELRYYQVPTLYIPLPHSYFQEQEMNARFMVQHQAAKILLQEEASPKQLVYHLEALMAQRKQFQTKLASVPLLDPKPASELIFQQLVEITS